MTESSHVGARWYSCWKCERKVDAFSSGDEHMLPSAFLRLTCFLGVILLSPFFSFLMASQHFLLTPLVEVQI